MEAKDTVMDNLAGAIIKHPDLPMGQAVAVEQAEISFKLGIKEVVEWMREHKYHGIGEIIIKRVEYEAKLKKWGIS